MNVLKNMEPSKALTGSEVVAGVLFLAAVAVYLKVVGIGFNIFWAVLAGTVAGFAIGGIAWFL